MQPNVGTKLKKKTFETVSPVAQVKELFSSMGVVSLG